jgi:hypothetical protein
MNHDNRSCDILLISPPAYYPWVIPPGLAYLGGYLEQSGFRVEVIDANVDGLEYLLTKCSENPVQTREAFRGLRDERQMKDWSSYTHIMRHLSDCAKKVSQRHREKLTFARNTLRYKPDFELRSRAGLLQAAYHWKKHLYAAYYEAELLPRLRQLRPLVVALSASDLHQLLPATVIAAMLREEFGHSSPKRLIGGNVFSRIYSSLVKPDALNTELHEIWGTVIIGEGEHAMATLMKAEKEGRSVAILEGQALPGGGVHKRQPPINLNELAKPRCEGFNPLIPCFPIPLNIYRGCYYSGGCSFCDINHGYDSVWASATPKLGKRGQRLRDLNLVVEDITHSIKRYGTRIFNFTDEWFRAKDMLKLAELLLANGIDIRWDAYCRLEPELARPEVGALLAKGGARFFQFGLESASLKTLRAVGKGTSPVISARILKNLYVAGIWNHVFIIVGLPGECLHEAIFTIAFIVEHAESIFTIKPTRFQLARHSPISISGGGDFLDVQSERDTAFDLALNRPFLYRSQKFCERCGSHAVVARDSDFCGTCKDRLILRPLVSRNAVNVMFTAMELVAAQHWAYPFTSLYPYHTRLLFSTEEARRIAKSREEATDRNLGLSAQQVTETLQALCRYLQWEAKHSRDVRNLYERTGLKCPTELGSVKELIGFACELAAKGLAGKSETEDAPRLVLSAAQN